MGAPVRWSERPSAALWVVAFGTFVAADDLMVVATMLRPIIGDLGLVVPDDLDDAAWIVNVYLIAYIAVMPIAGRLSDVFGRRAVFVASMAIFAVGSLVVPAADSLSVLLVGRALTAIGGGALVPLGLAVVSDRYEGGRRLRALGLLGAIETMGWVWGPLYGAILVRYLSWEWQFHLNIPLAILGIVVGWLVLDPARHEGDGIDWIGAGLLTVGLIALDVALLDEARIQSVTGLDQLTGNDDAGIVGPWLYAVAAIALAGFVYRERTAARPLLGLRSLMAGRRGTGVAVALGVNLITGAALVIALVDVPLFINVVEGDLERSAVIAGWTLTALTAAMAVTSYLGGVITERTWYRPPIRVGLVVAAAGFVVMGQTWTPDTSPVSMAVLLLFVGAGIGLVIAPTSAAVVDAAVPSARGAAAGLVILFRLLGFSVGLAGLTAWGLRRFDELRADLDLPALGEPGFEEALQEGQIQVTTEALAETFLASGVVLVVGLVLSGALRRHPAPEEPAQASSTG
ncbi:MAG: MFS transporter [Actinomycetota bacterium]